jgi:hypothetical protein
MRFLRCVHAEVLLLAPRLTRTRLGFLLLALGATLVWLHARGLDPLTTALQAGALGAIIGAAAMAGSESDRAALATTLSHPTTTLAVATGRWIAVVVPALLLTIVCAAAVGFHGAALFAGIAAAAAVGGCALAVVVPLGNSAAAALFFFMAVAGAVAPERLVALAQPGLVRLTAASALELGPALWHYRDIATGDLGALLHALAWTGLGILLTSAFIARQRAFR